MKILKKGRNVKDDVFRGTCKQCEESIELIRHEIGTSSDLSQWRCSNCQGWIDVRLQQPTVNEVEAQVEEELAHLSEYLENWNPKPQDSLTAKPEATLNVGSSPTLASELERLEHSIIDMCIKGTIPERYSSVSELCVANLCRQHAALKKLAYKARKHYNELLYAVANKYPNETRHQTALRYIKEREERIHPPVTDAGSTDTRTFRHF